MNIPYSTLLANMRSYTLKGKISNFSNNKQRGANSGGIF